jgi:apolipoprotein N-acyltransferase
MIDERRRYYNSCYLFSPEGHMGRRHDKVKLVPFTEQVPYQDDLPFLRKEFLTKYLTFIETYDVNWWSDFYPGREATISRFDDTRFGTLICFECTFPEFTRQMLLDGADFLVGITNDTWFGHSVGIYMHSRIFLTRAVENRCWMARCANSGLTYIVDGYGRIRRDLPLDAVSALRGKVRGIDGFSFFTRHGDLVGRLSFLLTVSLAFILVLVWLIGKFLPLRRAR